MLEVLSSQNNRRVVLRIKNLDAATDRGIRQGFFRLGARLKAELQKEVLVKNKTGRVYRRGRRRHRSSGAGQTPANLTGNYRKNIGFQIRGATQMQFGIHDGAPYAVFLEEGTSKMEARPGLGNAVKAVSRDARSLLESSLRTELLR